ncbi:hypothetical protein UXN85_20835 [Enterobacter hormaechei]
MTEQLTIPALEKFLRAVNDATAKATNSPAHRVLAERELRDMLTMDVLHAALSRLLAFERAAAGVEIPAPPVRVLHRWEGAKYAHCDYCGRWASTVIDDGETICADCCDADYLNEWENYANQLVMRLKGAACV